MITKSEENRLRLIWLSCKDWRFLEQKKNQILLKNMYEEIKVQLVDLFQSYQTPFDSIITAFNKIYFTIDPRYPAGYDPEKNQLIWNLWTFFFALAPDLFTSKKCVISAPIWKVGSELIHEFDHFQFAEKNGIIGMPESDREAFDQKTGNQREKRALLRQIDFLKHSKVKVPYDTPINFIKVKKWGNNGNIRDIRKACLTEALIERSAIVKSIDSFISDLNNVIATINSGKNYDKVADKENFEKSLLFVKALSLPIKFDFNQKDYPQMELEL